MEKQNLGILIINAMSIARLTESYALIIDNFDKIDPSKMKAAKSSSTEGKPLYMVYSDGSYEKFDPRKVVDLFAADGDDYYE